MNLKTRKYVLFGVLTAISIALDQWTKVLARAKLRHHEAHVVIKKFFTLSYSENRGVAFGILGGLPPFVLTLVAVVAFGLVVHYLYKSEDRHTRMHVALGLVGGGAIGNLIDRVLYQRVTDFIVFDLGFPPFHPWPAFNIADAVLVIGVALMGVDMLLAPKPAKVKDR
ncbi:MAG TPA: signal peptidase II [Polyangia bacterium]|nr:signal peptidase II [Polyangia bacterium]